MSQDPARSYRYLERRSIVPINLALKLQEDVAYRKSREDLFKPLTHKVVNHSYFVFHTHVNTKYFLRVGRRLREKRPG